MPAMLTSWDSLPGSISELETSWSFQKALHQVGWDSRDAPEVVPAKRIHGPSSSQPWWLKSQEASRAAAPCQCRHPHPDPNSAPGPG